MQQVILKDLVQDTYTNASGISFAIQLEKYIKKEEPVEISISGTSPISSSFFNSSFGDLIEKYGYDKIKQLIKFTGVNASQGKLLRNYFDGYSNYNLS